jgi:hypothetical protein
VGFIKHHDIVSDDEPIVSILEREQVEEERVIDDYKLGLPCRFPNSLVMAPPPARSRAAYTTL